MNLDTLAKFLPWICGVLRFFTRRKPSAPRVLWSLIVEDNQRDAELLELVLRRGGFQTQTASCGEAARGMLKRDSYDLILVDLQLPGMSGAALLRVLSDDSPYARVVVVTGCAADLPPGEPIVVVVKPITDDSVTKMMRLLKPYPNA